MDQHAIARIFEEIAAILEIKGENPFKIRAYHNAARILDGFAGNLSLLMKENRLEEIQGVGKNLADHIQEILRT